MKNFNKTFVIILYTILFGGCDKQLELAPQSIISLNNFYQSEDDVVVALNGVYSKFRTVATTLYLYGDFRSENTVAGDLGVGHDANRNTIQPTTGGTDWGAYYSMINDANLLLRFGEEIPFENQTQKDDIMAQAKFIRAWGYFMIAKIWGDAPLLTEGFISSTQEGLLPESRNSVSELFAFIKTELDEAIGLFASSGLSDKYRASRPAANALRADVYSWTAKRMGGGAADFNVALSAVNAAITDSGTSLLPNFLDVFRPTVATDEDIFSIFHSIDESVGFFASQYNLSDSFHAQLPAAEQDRIPFILGSVRFFAASQVFRDAIIANANGNSDARESVYFLDYLDSSGNPFHVMNKYQGEETSPGIREFTDDFKIYRMAGLLLMKAEILNGLDQTADAVIELNKVRNRAGIGVYTGALNKNDVDDAILAEMGIELAFEGKRFFDLVRFGKAFDLVPTLAGQTDEGILVWPLSTNTLSQNPNLTQNPFYN